MERATDRLHVFFVWPNPIHNTATDGSHGGTKNNKIMETKKMYQSPVVEVCQIENHSQLLAGSYTETGDTTDVE